MARIMVPLANKSGLISSATLLERYEIVSELGRGAIGIVYRAFDRVLERAVAIKTLKPDLPEDIADEMKARFVREAKSAGRVNRGRQNYGFRPRAHALLIHDPRGHRSRLSQIHVAGAGSRAAVRSACRHLLARCRALRDARRQDAV